MRIDVEYNRQISAQPAILEKIMKTKHVILIMLIFTIQLSILYSVVWEVKKDGMGDYTQVQEAINNAASGDSILVFPGRYVENINYFGKSISLYSLAVTTGNDEYVMQTIIDGNEQGSVVTILECSDAYLGGFAITGGRGSVPCGTTYKGGGIFVEESIVVIEDCFIHNNRSVRGGGIHLSRSHVTFKGNTVTDNSSTHSGGGICIHPGGWDDSQAYIFDTVKKNNVYLNTGLRGHEIYGEQIPYLDIVLQKGSVTHQDPYFYHFNKSCGNVTVSAETSAIEQTANNLYVAVWGSDENSGLTPNEPLQRISYALMKVVADSLNPKTIFIEEGVYSPTLTGELLPLHLKPYVTLTSSEEGKRWTLDAEGEYNFGGSAVDVGDISVMNAVFKGGIFRWPTTPFVAVPNGHKVVLKNIDFRDMFFDSGFKGAQLHSGEGVFGSSYSKEVVYDNIRVYGNPYGAGGGCSLCEESPQKGTFNRLYIENTARKGFQISLSQGGRKKTDVVLSNSIIVNTANKSEFINPIFDGFHTNVSLSIYGSHQGESLPIETKKVRVINCTIAGNDCDNGAIHVTNRVFVEFYNNIIYGNKRNTVFLDGTFYQGKAFFSHNLFENGASDIIVHEYECSQEHSFSGDPLFLGEGSHPYQLSEGSPAINAGTTDIPDYTFEEYDLAGNPRIYDGRIDLGAYEYQYTTAEERFNDKYEQKISSIAYPNPASLRKQSGYSLCVIKFIMPMTSDVVVSVYNVKGQRVRTLTTGQLGEGEHILSWDGTNNRGDKVGTGMYYYKIQTETMEHTGQVMVIK